MSPVSREQYFRSAPQSAMESTSSRHHADSSHPTVLMAAQSEQSACRKHPTCEGIVITSVAQRIYKRQCVLPHAEKMARNPRIPACSARESAMSVCMKQTGQRGVSVRFSAPVSPEYRKKLDDFGVSG